MSEHREAKAWREPGGSVFHCVFLPYQPTKLRAAFQKWDPQKRKLLKELHGKLEFTMTASVDGNPAVEGSTKAKFAGGFQIVDSLPAEVGFLILRFVFCCHLHISNVNEC